MRLALWHAAKVHQARWRRGRRPRSTEQLLNAARRVALRCGARSELRVFSARQVYAPDLQQPHSGATAPSTAALVAAVHLRRNAAAAAHGLLDLAQHPTHLSVALVLCHLRQLLWTSRPVQPRRPRWSAHRCDVYLVLLPVTSPLERAQSTGKKNARLPCLLAHCTSRALVGMSACESSDDGGDGVEMWSLFEGWESIPDGGLVTLADHEDGTPFSLTLSAAFRDELAPSTCAAVTRGAVTVAQDMVLRRRVLEVEDGFGALSENESQSATGAVVWNTSVVVAAWLEANRALVRRWVVDAARVDDPARRPAAVELGAGCGLCSVLLALVVEAAAAAGRTVATDREEMLPLLRRNCAANVALSAAGGSDSGGGLTVAPLWWGDAATTAAIAPPFDFIVATDCVYDYEIIEPLLACLNALSHSATRVLLGFDEAIGHYEVYREFWKAAATHGWVAAEVPLTATQVDSEIDELDAKSLRGEKKTKARSGGSMPRLAAATAEGDVFVPVPDACLSPMVRVWLLSREQRETS